MLLRVGELGDDALAAAARFHADVLPRVRAALAQGPQLLIVLFSPAGPAHRGWRLAAVQELARQAAPARVNALVGDDEAVIAAAARYLDAAPGLTGQVLPLDGKGAGAVLYSPA